GFVPRGAEDAFASGGTHSAQAVGMEGQVDNLSEEVFVGFGDEAGDAGNNEVLGSARRGDDGRNTGGRGLLHDVAEGVGARRKNEQIHVGVGFGEEMPAKNAGEVAVAEVALEPRALAAVADDEYGKVVEAGPQQSALNVD